LENFNQEMQAIDRIPLVKKVKRREVISPSPLQNFLTNLTKTITSRLDHNTNAGTGNYARYFVCTPEYLSSRISSAACKRRLMNLATL
jgi:hypothetical protein